MLRMGSKKRQRLAPDIERDHARSVGKHAPVRHLAFTASRIQDDRRRRFADRRAYPLEKPAQHETYYRIAIVIFLLHAGLIHINPRCGTAKSIFRLCTPADTYPASHKPGLSAPSISPAAGRVSSWWYS